MVLFSLLPTVNFQITVVICVYIKEKILNDYRKPDFVKNRLIVNCSQLQIDDKVFF